VNYHSVLTLTMLSLLVCRPIVTFSRPYGSVDYRLKTHEGHDLYVNRAKRAK